MTALQAQYALIRYIPSTLREEFINIGVVLVCPAANFQELKALPSFDTRQGKLSVFDGADGRFVRHAVTKLSTILAERRIDELIGSRSAPDGVLNLEGLEILRSTYHNNIQLSEPRMLLTDNPVASLHELYSAFVGTQPVEPAPARITRGAMRRHVASEFSKYQLFRRYPDRVRQQFRPLNWAGTVDFSYSNGAIHYYQLVPFTTHEQASEVVGNYLTIVSDLRNSDFAGSTARHSTFSVLGHYSPEPGQTQELEAIQDRLRRSDVQLLDYREDTPRIAERISRELQAESGLDFSSAR